MRINLGAYSDHTNQKSISQTKMHTPHIDELAKRGVVFDRVQLYLYCMHKIYQLMVFKCQICYIAFVISFNNLKLFVFIDLRMHSVSFFLQAFVSYPFCAPSRASLLTGRRPQTTKVLGSGSEESFRTLSGNRDMVTLPGYFKDNGYKTFSYGKVCTSMSCTISSQQQIFGMGSHDIVKIFFFKKVAGVQQKRRISERVLYLNVKNSIMELRPSTSWS